MANIGDRFYMPGYHGGQYFTITEDRKTSSRPFYTARFSDSFSNTTIYVDEIEALRIYQYELIKIIDDKHLMILRLQND